jgi:hypothetical protein
MATVKVTDQSFEQDVLKATTPWSWISGPSGAAPAA